MRLQQGCEEYFQVLTEREYYQVRGNDDEKREKERRKRVGEKGGEGTRRGKL
jgi:hypothetical protein